MAEGHGATVSKSRPPAPPPSPAALAPSAALPPTLALGGRPSFGSSPGSVSSAGGDFGASVARLTAGPVAREWLRRRADVATAKALAAPRVAPPRRLRQADRPAAQLHGGVRPARHERGGGRGAGGQPLALPGGPS
eukprot:15141531-Alexandrium_andersonii.AAC.1